MVFIYVQSMGDSVLEISLAKPPTDKKKGKPQRGMMGGYSIFITSLFILLTELQSL